MVILMGMILMTGMILRKGRILRMGRKTRDYEMMGFMSLNERSGRGMVRGKSPHKTLRMNQ
jgi:hypothetical protein